MRSNYLTASGLLALSWSSLVLLGYVAVATNGAVAAATSTKTNHKATSSSSGPTASIEDFFAKLGRSKFNQALVDHGVYLSASYLGEFGANVHGGQKPHHHTYADQEAWGATTDLNKLAGWKGGWLQAIFTYRHGHNLGGKYINNSISVQQIYGDGQTFRLTTLAFMQTFANNKLNILVGRLPAKSSYFISDYYCNFQSNAICGNPATITKNTNPTSFPMPAWGGRVRYFFTPHIYATAGVYEAVNSDYVKRSKHGFYWGTRYDKGVWIPFELKYRTTMKDAPYPAMLSLGGAYDTGNGRDGEGHKYGHRVMIWTQAEKMIWKPDPDGTRGVALFSGLSLGTSKHQTYQYQLLGGLNYQGPFASRPDDIAAFMATALRRTKHNRSGPTKRHPTYFTLEANYSYQAVRGVVITPNFQYVVHPDGGGGHIAAPSNGRIKNAIVLGTQVSIDMNKLMKTPKSGMPD